MDMAAELRILTRQFRCMICSRERDMHGHIVAGVLAQKLRFKAGDERAAAEDQRLLFGRAARKLLAVRKACVVEHQLVSVLRRTVENGRPTLALLLQAHQLSGDLLVRNVHMLESGPQAAVFEFHGDRRDQDIARNDAIFRGEAGFKVVRVQHLTAGREFFVSGVDHDLHPVAA